MQTEFEVEIVAQTFDIDKYIEESGVDRPQLNWQGFTLEAKVIVNETWSF